MLLLVAYNGGVISRTVNPNEVGWVHFADQRNYISF